MHRRTFVKSAMMAGAVSMMPMPLFLEKGKKRVGVQLWSVRDDMGKDPRGTLKELARMGYRDVEGFGYNEGKFFGLSAADFGKALMDNNLKMPSIHGMVTGKSFNEKTGQFDDAFKKMVDDCASIGVKYVIAPWMVDEDRATPSKIANVFNRAGEYVKMKGMKFGYHNHDFEFKNVDGKPLYQHLLDNTDKKLVIFEMDMYWVVFAQQDPVDWFKRYAGRFELVHVKDLAKTEKRESVEVGDGSIDFKSMFVHAKKAGVKHYVVELEHYVTTPMKGVEKSLIGLNKILG